MRTYFVFAFLLVFSVVHFVCAAMFQDLVSLIVDLFSVAACLLIISKFYKRTVSMTRLDPGYTALYPCVIIDYEKGKRLAYIIVLYKRAYIIDYRSK